MGILYILTTIYFSLLSRIWLSMFRKVHKWTDLTSGSWSFDLLFFSPFSVFCNKCRSLSISSGCGQLCIYFLELDPRTCNIHCFPSLLSQDQTTPAKVFGNSDWCQSSAQIQLEWYSHCCHESQALLALISSWLWFPWVYLCWSEDWERYKLLVNCWTLCSVW